MVKAITIIMIDILKMRVLDKHVKLKHFNTFLLLLKLKIKYDRFLIGR